MVASCELPLTAACIFTLKKWKWQTLQFGYVHHCHIQFKLSIGGTIHTRYQIHLLVGGFNPSEKYDFVSWDDDIPN